MCGEDHIFLQNGSEIFAATGLAGAMRLMDQAKLVFCRRRFRRALRHM